MKKTIVSFGLIGLLIAGQAVAGNKEIQHTLQKLEIPKEGIKIFPTSLAGINIATTKKGLFYITDDGRYISQGPIFDMKSGSPQSLSHHVVKLLVSPLIKEAISFKAEQEKYQITVFTDITCSHCKKLHEQTKQYNQQGITVNYLAFPREGRYSEAAEQMQSIWSAVDSKSALNESYQGKRVPKANGMIAYVAHHFEVGKQIGITGTPTIVFPNGEVIGGYVPPEKLKEMLNHIQ